MVLFNRSQEGEGLSAVTSDNVAGGAQVARFLLAGGHARIGYIAGWEGASTQIDREAGFRAGLEAAGVPLFARGVGNFNFETAKQAARDMFTAPERPDAVFVCNDHMAFAVMDVLRFELGLRVPQDVSVVGYDDVTLSRWPSYDLTTMRQPVNRMIDATMSVLRSVLVGEEPPFKIQLIPGRLIERKSTRSGAPT